MIGRPRLGPNFAPRLGVDDGHSAGSVEKTGANSAPVVYGAIAADAAVGVAKFVAAGMSGSSSMLSEGIHQTVDTANTCLLLPGQRLGRRPPDQPHPFGDAREIYFWSLLVAIDIFGLGDGMST